MLAALPLVVQHAVLDSGMRDEIGARAGTFSAAAASLIESRLGASFERYRSLAGSLARHESIRRAVDPRSEGGQALIVDLRRNASEFLASSVFALEKGAAARLVAPDGIVLASSSSREVGASLSHVPDLSVASASQPPIVGLRRHDAIEPHFDFVARVPTPSFDRETPSLVLRIPARAFDEQVRASLAELGPGARVLGVDASGACAIDSEGALLASRIDAPGADVLSRWASQRAFGEKTHELLQTFAHAPRLLALVDRADLGGREVQLRHVAAAKIDFVVVSPTEEASGSLRTAQGVAVALTLLVAGAILAVALSRRGEESVAVRGAIGGPVLAGLVVLVGATAATLYVARALEVRGQELLESFSRHLEHSLRIDFERSVLSRTVLLADARGRLRGAADVPSEFRVLAADALRAFPGGQLVLWPARRDGVPEPDPIVVPAGPLRVRRVVPEPNQLRALGQPEARFQGLTSEGEALLVLEMEVGLPEGLCAVTWSVELAVLSAEVLAPARTGGFTAKLVHAGETPQVLYPAGMPISDSDLRGPVFRLPGAKSSEFQLVFAPGMDLFGAQSSRTIVLLFGLLFATGGAVATTLILASSSAHRRASRLDALTGLRNRLEFHEMLGRERRRATRYGRPLAVALLDLDHFKRLNDTFGHGAGDLVLQGVAQLLESSVRGADFVFRHGGEEFAVLLPETSPEDAFAVVQRLRERFAEGALPGLETYGIVTLSAGVATLEGDESVDSILARADSALYEAKRAGRNRVCEAKPRSPSAKPAVPKQLGVEV